MIGEQQIAKAKEERKQQSIKCIVWDLDHTLWHGILLEGDDPVLREGVVAVIQEMDRRGILHSIASRNDESAAMQELKKFGLEEYFLYPQINWELKSKSIKTIAEKLNIGLDTFAFIDDQPFEREEVAFTHPEVLCITPEEIPEIPKMPRMRPRFITSESQLRRQMYQSDFARDEAEKGFEGANKEFLASLNMKFEIRMATENDLKRAEELTQRTHQLNSTGYTYPYDELDQLRRSSDHLLLVSSLEDKFGTYGTIGLALVKLGESFWTICLLLMSCRVMSRGVGTVMLSYIMNLAKQANVSLRGLFVPNGRNRMMYVSYKFGGFREIEEQDGLIVLENDLARIQPFPNYLEVVTPELSGVSYRARGRGARA